jgi:hypothetical protein
MPATVLTCVDLSAMPVGPGPTVVGPLVFKAFDHTGAAVPTTIRTQGTFRGLDCARRLDVTFRRRPAQAICLSIAHWARPAKIDFYGPSGVIATVTIPAAQNVAHEVVATGRAILRVVITAPSDETLLLKFCYG